MVAILRGILLKDNGVTELWTDVLALLVYAGLMLLLATRRFVRRLA
jgi:predicted branched-subunit amino acid permease